MREVGAGLSVDLSHGESLLVEENLEAQIIAAFERGGRDGFIGHAFGKRAGSSARLLSGCNRSKGKDDDARNSRAHELTYLSHKLPPAEKLHDACLAASTVRDSFR